MITDHAFLLQQSNHEFMMVAILEGLPLSITQTLGLFYEILGDGSHQGSRIL
jgi:hypothetical protein